MKRILFCVLLVAAAMTPWAAWAEEAKIPTVKFQLHPAAEPSPALKYQLLPGFLDRKPGNAAVTYNKVLLVLTQCRTFDKDLQDRLGKWMETPLAELPRDEIAKKLGGYRQSVLDPLDRAARRETCDWDLPIREEDPFMVLLPEIQESRALARLLAVQARLQIATGEYDKAVHTLQTGYALGRHVAEGPTIVNALIGMAICGVMSEQLEQLIQQPGSPNLYWALATLPQPIISLRKAAEEEMMFPYLMFPGLGEVDKDNHDVEYYQAFLDRMFDEIGKLSGNVGFPKAGLRPAVAALAIKGYPDARRALIKQGRSAAEVDAMPVAQVVLIYTVQTNNEFRDQLFKWSTLPYWQARPGIEKAEQYLRREGRNREIIPIASLLLPAVGVAKTAEARCDRTIALLRTLEALRLYAAGHEGRLPSKLEDVTDVPIPIDPMTGKSFLYECHGKTAVLEAPAPPKMSREDYAKRYEIEVK